MTYRFRSGLALLLAVVAGAGVCEAQSGLPTVYVQVGPALTVHAEGDQYQRASPPLKGKTFGAAAAVGARFSPVAGAEVALSIERALSAEQADVYFTRTDYTAESRDTVIDVNLRFRPRGGSRIEFTAGGGWARTRLARRDVVFSSALSPGTKQAGPAIETSLWAPTLSGAVAVAVPLSDRVELVPSVGVRWIRREIDSEAWYLGVGRYTLVSTVAFRVRR